MQSRRAFSLLEISVALVLMGALAGVLLQFKPNDVTECNATTKSQLKQVEKAMHEYVIAHDRFPVPAMRTLGVEDTQYGREAPMSSLNSTGGVLYGALPFQALGLSPSFAGDCWGNKFTYAVTANLTDSAKFKSTAPNPVYDGVITLMASPTMVMNTKIAYAVVSHGADGIGAAKLNYSDSTNTQRKWCAGTPAQVGMINCSANSNIIMATDYNDGKANPNDAFDDIVIYGGKEQRIVNGQCDNSYALGCVKGYVSNATGTSACNTTRTWHCDGANGGTNDTSCSFTNPVCLNCSSTSLTWGAGCSGTFPATAHAATSAPATANSNPAFTASSSATAVCNNGVFDPPLGSCVAVPPPVPGVCNNAAPLSCISGGAPIADNGAIACSTTRTWICPGLNGGANSPTCAYANTACLNCNAQNLNWGAGCTASFSGAVSGGTATPAPNANTNPTFTGSAIASCYNGVMTAGGPCNPIVPIPGACDNSTVGGCASGIFNAGSLTNNGVCGTTSTWTCDGQNGGAPDTSCSAANPACVPTCGTAAGASTPYAPTFNLCSDGSLPGVSHSGGMWRWTCNSDNCSAPISTPPLSAGCDVDELLYANGYGGEKPNQEDYANCGSNYYSSGNQIVASVGTTLEYNLTVSGYQHFWTFGEFASGDPSLLNRFAFNWYGGLDAFTHYNYGDSFVAAPVSNGVYTQFVTVTDTYNGNAVTLSVTASKNTQPPICSSCSEP